MARRAYLIDIYDLVATQIDMDIIDEIRRVVIWINCINLMASPTGLNSYITDELWLPFSGAA